MTTLAAPIVPLRRSESHREISAYVGMMVFLGGWAMMFAGLIFAYAGVRARAESWPPPDEILAPLSLAIVNTAVLITSSFTLWQAVQAFRNVRPQRGKVLLAVTLALGTLFVGLQSLNWQRLVAQGLTTSSSSYGSVFYTLTVFHALHVLVGLVGLATVVVRALYGKFSAHYHTPVRLWSIYWHFVDGVWLVLFFTFYLL